MKPYHLRDQKMLPPLSEAGTDILNKKGIPTTHTGNWIIGTMGFSVCAGTGHCPKTKFPILSSFSPEFSTKKNLAPGKILLGTGAEPLFGLSSRNLPVCLLKNHFGKFYHGAVCFARAFSIFRHLSFLRLFPLGVGYSKNFPSALLSAKHNPGAASGGSGACLFQIPRLPQKGGPRNFPVGRDLPIARLYYLSNLRRSASGVLIGAIWNFSAKYCSTVGEINAGRVGPRRIF